MSALCQKQTYGVQQIPAYSITSSARASSGGGTVRPSAFAVFRLMNQCRTATNLVLRASPLAHYQHDTPLAPVTPQTICTLN